jgi:hypothetical protein
MLGVILVVDIQGHSGVDPTKRVKGSLLHMKRCRRARSNILIPGDNNKKHHFNRQIQFRMTICVVPAVYKYKYNSG